MCVINYSKLIFDAEIRAVEVEGDGVRFLVFMEETCRADQGFPKGGGGVKIYRATIPDTMG